MRIAIGIDVSKEKLDLCWLKEPDSGKKKTKVFKNHPDGHQDLVNWLVKQTQSNPEEMLITLEPTGVYHETLLYTLHEQGFHLFVANPGRARKHGESLGVTHKTDKADSVLLARYGHSRPQPFTLWQPEAFEIRELKAMIRRLDALEADLQRERNRQESSELSAASVRVIQSLEDMIRVLETEIELLKRDIDDHIDRHPELKNHRELLESIQGVGPVMSRELVYLFAAKAFKDARQVAAYLGLIPRLKESGQWKGHTTLSKTGPARLRAKLYMAAVSASTHNPDIRRQKERLLKAGKSPMSALGAAMRKLVQICFGVIKHQSKYQPQPV